VLSSSEDDSEDGTIAP